MSTRANIAIEDKNGSVSAIYIHYGNINDIGDVLDKYYSTYSSAKKLIKLGDLVSISKDGKPEVMKDGDKAKHYVNNNDFCKHTNSMFIEFVYLYNVYTEDWTVLDTRTNKYIPLSSLISSTIIKPSDLDSILATIQKIKK
jgi:hypothetical protein